MSDTQTAIAIVGMACRFPGAPSLDAYWKLLCEGVDAITEVPADRWSLQEFYDADPSLPGKMNARWGGFIDNIDRFDASFFGISPRETASVSPQQRLLLEVAWHAVENAGIAMKDLSAKNSATEARTGVFVGVASFDYYDRVAQDPARMNGYSLTGNAYSITANRLSYVFDLRGPSIAVDTACSSSLVAIHLACQSLAAGECSTALAGGVQIMMSPWVSVAASKGEFLSPDGRCKTFDESANGYVRGEGVGMLVLKRLEDAERDGDRIWAVVRGSAVNQDGRSNGLTAPNPTAQIDVISTALRRANVSPENIGYIEAHGTGTRLGDPIELNALGSVLGQRKNPCFVGSVKSNFGHLEAAAGVAGLIKSVLCVHYGEIVPNLHFSRPNPLIDFANLPFVVPTQRQSWPNDVTRIAGVSSFGFGGTNAHVVIEAARSSGLSSPQAHSEPALLCLSARTVPALAQLAESYAAWLRAFPHVPVFDAAATAAHGRNVMGERTAVVLDSPQNAAVSLERTATELRVRRTVPGRKPPKPRIAFLFTGQGAQYVGMGQALLDRFPVYRETWRQADELLHGILGESLSQAVYGSNATEEILSQTRYTQPAQYVLQVGLARILAEYGIEPAIVLGHSVGEIAAAYCAGILSFEDGLRLVAHRAASMQECEPGGAMLAVRLSCTDACALLKQHDSSAVIAATNSPNSVVISGPLADIAAAEQMFSQQGIPTARLHVSHAFHSEAMAPAAKKLRDFAERLAHCGAAVPFISSMTADLLADDIEWSTYWSDQVLKPVEFESAASRLAQHKPDVVIEIGPRPVLSQHAAHHFENAKRVMCVLNRNTSDVAGLLAAVGACFESGVDLRFDRLYPAGWQKQRLPGYPFEQQVHQLYPPVAQRLALATESSNRLQYAFMTNALVEERTDGGFSISIPLSSRRFPYLSDHTVLDADVLPATGFIELAQAAAYQVTGNNHWRFEKLEFRRPLMVEPEDLCIRVELTRSNDTAWRFVITDDIPDRTKSNLESAAYSCGVLKAYTEIVEAAA